jgi:hypothetical protein
MYNNTISGTATEKGASFFSCCARDSIIVHVVLYCIYIIITSFFSCCARNSIIVHVVLYCNSIIITSFFISGRATEKEGNDNIITVYNYMYNNTISGTATEKGGNDNIITVYNYMYNDTISGRALYM